MRIDGLTDYVMLVFAIVVFGVFSGLIHLPQQVVYETADQNAIRTCLTNNDINLNAAIERGNQLTTCNEQLRVCQTTKPDNFPWLVLLYLPLMAMGGWYAKSLFDEVKILKEMKKDRKDET